MDVAYMSCVCSQLHMYFLNFRINEQGRRQYAFFFPNSNGIGGEYYRCTAALNFTRAARVCLVAHCLHCYYKDVDVWQQVALAACPWPA